MINRGTQTNVPLVSETQNSAGSVRPVCSGPALNRPEAVLWLHAVCALHAAYSLTVVRRRDTKAIKTWLYFVYKTENESWSTASDRRRPLRLLAAVRREASVQRSVERGNDALCFPIILSARLDAHRTHPPPPPPSSSCRRTSSHLQDVTDGDEPSVVLCSFSGRLSSNLRWAVSQTASQEKNTEVRK